MKECNVCLFNEENYPAIQLNEDGVCDICLINNKRIQRARHERTPEMLKKRIEKIKNDRVGEYDCLIGISGGADSTYMVYLAKQWGLNPLLFHVDGGWNSDISVSNIRKIADKSGFDYIAEVLPWEEIKDVQRAFVMAGVIDIDLPFDNLMLSYNYRLAKKHKIKHIFFGTSSDTEGIMPKSFTHYKLDRKNIRSIHKKWGTRSVNGLKFIGTLEFLRFSRINKISMDLPIDWVEYNKEDVKRTIIKEFDWKDYGWKHNESIYTRFYQNYILPEKFKVDKRISHLSMLICSGQLTKADAKQMLVNAGPYANIEAKNADKNFFIKKLNLTPAEFEKYIKTAPVSHRDYKSDLDMYDLFRRNYRYFKKIFRINTFGT